MLLCYIFRDNKHKNLIVLYKEEVKIVQPRGNVQSVIEAASTPQLHLVTTESAITVEGEGVSNELYA